MFTIFWDYRGIIKLEDMIKGKKIKFLDGKEKKKKKRLLQHDKARHHTSTATSVAIALGFKLFHILPTASLWHCLTYGCPQLLRNISREFMSYVMKKFKLLGENGFESSMTSTTTGSKNLFGDGSVVSN